MLKTYNLMVKFLKYEFNNKLLGGVTLLRVTPGVTLNNITPPNIFNWMWILTNLPLDYIIFMHYPCLQNFKIKYQ